jgi:haloalkane dehalogenase
MTAPIEQHDVVIDGKRIHYRTCGTGHVVLLVHGWPTSSYLWRNVMPAIAAGGMRAVALDLPGFGGSDKPADGSYSFPFFSRVLDGFVDHLGVRTVDLVVHDLGGPVGLFWAATHPERVERLALLNTIVYPELSWAVLLFMGLNALPVVRDLFTTPRGLAWAMNFGVARPLPSDVMAEYLAPFAERGARRALQKAAGSNLHRDGMKKIEAYIKSLQIPVRLIYGDRDPILPEIGRTMSRVKRDVPHAELTVLPGAKHFIHEDCPDELGRMLAEFSAAPRRDRRAAT